MLQCKTKGRVSGCRRIFPKERFDFQMIAVQNASCATRAVDAKDLCKALLLTKFCHAREGGHPVTTALTILT
jgi:hypothetical protein